MKGTAASIIVTMIGVILAIYAAESRVRLDWPETALVVGAALVTVGIIKLAEATKKGESNDL